MGGLAGFLGSNGIEVDFAVTGAAGLRMARSGSYAAILLDLRLPDLDGLDLLKRLCATQRAPVIVFSGFGTIESAMDAGRIGAARFLCKPVSGAAMLQVLREVDFSTASHAEEPVALFRGSSSVGPSETVTAVLELLGQIADPGAGSLTAVAAGRLRHLAARAAADPGVTLFEFVALLRVLRCIFPRGPARSADVLRIRDRLLEAARRSWHGVQPDTQAIMSHMETMGPALIHATKERLAASLNLTPTILTRDLRRDLRFSLRLLRRVILMRRAALALATSDEQVAQIAYVLGYEHASPLDRMFKRTFGMSPGEFRQAVDRWRIPPEVG
jgi:AraC-like DNA-binding protein/CheY-like chemotaxis protein